MVRDELTRDTTLLPQQKVHCGSRSTYKHTCSMVTADNPAKLTIHSALHLRD